MNKQNENTSLKINADAVKRQIDLLVINFWAVFGKLTRRFRKHNFEYIGTGKCYHQKSKLGKCTKCGVIGFVPKREKDFRMINNYGCDASPKHL